MEKIVIEISDDIMRKLDLSRKDEISEIFMEGLKRVKIQRALRLYQSGAISFGKASEIAEVREDELATEAYALDIEPTYDDATIKEESE